MPDHGAAVHIGIPSRRGCPEASACFGVHSDHRTGRLALVFELMDKNIYELIRGRGMHMPEQLVRQYMWQLLQALDHMHRSGIFHRCVLPLPALAC